ncbi:MAG: hopanoid methylase [Pseudonocardiales bacterium]|nr:hopanoid methylase [Pseudonocardiales bacterium]
MKEPGVFVVDDVASIRPEHGDAIAAELERRNIHKSYYLETRADVLLRNQEVFQRWRRLGRKYMFLGMEALDAEGLDRFCKRVSPDDSFRTLEVARSSAWPLDYRLFAIQHAVLPTRLPLAEFYRELVKTQEVINRKDLGAAALAKTARIVGRHMARRTSPAC